MCWLCQALDKLLVPLDSCGYRDTYRKRFRILRHQHQCMSDKFRSNRSSVPIKGLSNHNTALRSERNITINEIPAIALNGYINRLSGIFSAIDNLLKY